MEKEKERSPIPSGVHVAVYHGRVVTTGRTALQALERAKEAMPDVDPSEFVLEHASSAERLIL